MKLLVMSVALFIVHGTFIPMHIEDMVFQIHNIHRIRKRGISKSIQVFMGQLVQVINGTLFIIIMHGNFCLDSFCKLIWAIIPFCLVLSFEITNAMWESKKFI